MEAEGREEVTRPRFRALAASAGATLALLLPASAAQGATLEVTSTASSGPATLREAITRANDELNNPGVDVIQITATGTIDLTTQLPSVSSPVQIEGPGASQLTIRRAAAAPAFRILTFGVVNSTVRGVTIRGGRLSGPNVAGGGIYSQGTLTVESSVVTDNSLSASTLGQGAGIYSPGTLTVRDSTVSENEIDGAGQRYGVGIASFDTNPVTVERSAVYGNIGGTALQVGSSMTVENSTVSDNTAGIMIVGEPTETFVVSSSTIAANGTDNLRAVNSGVEVTLQNSIIADVLAGQNCTTGMGASFVSGGHNLSDDASCGLAPAEADQPSTEPQLGPLQDNGGPTFTHAIAAGSPAHDAGASAGLATDQRGLARPYDDPADANAAGGDGADIGAFELRPPEPPPDDARCKGKVATITGTDAKDVIPGTPKADVIVAGDGNDKVKAKAGKDLVCGGDGNDVLKGGGGKDTLLGEAGKDKLRGGGGKDKLRGGPGKDSERQ